MSLGIGAHANLIDEDKYFVMYEYGGYKINIESLDPTREVSMREVYGLKPSDSE